MERNTHYAQRVDTTAVPRPALPALYTAKIDCLVVDCAHLIRATTGPVALDLIKKFWRSRSWSVQWPSGDVYDLGCSAVTLGRVRDASCSVFKGGDVWGAR
eukprot:gene341-biopygen145